MTTHRTHHNSTTESRNSEANQSKGFGSLPYIFDNRKHGNLTRKMDLPNIDSVHFIKHSPLRLSRTRVSAPLINPEEYFNTDLQYEIDHQRLPFSSFQYDNESNLFSKGFCRRTSAATDNENGSVTSSDVILTPFAQILSNLHSVRDNILEIGNQAYSYTTTNNTFEQKNENHNTDKDLDTTMDTYFPNIVTVTCETLDWCLRTLEGIQTHRAVSNLTAIKFQRIINHELQQSDKDSVSDIQMCDYIYDTFLEKPLMDDEAFMDGKNTSICNSKNIPDVLHVKVQSDNDAKTLKLLDSIIDEWGIDLFEIHQMTTNVLALTTFSIFKKRGFMSKFNIPQEILFNFLIKLEKSYQKVPYHNSIHAADVTQSSHVILNSADLQDVFTDLEMLAVIFASAIHDVDHPGVTNQYLINTNDALATLYNDHSVLENHHLATAFRLLKNDKYDILRNLHKQEKSKFRKLVIDMVLATDMASHMTLLADLRTMVESKKVVGQGNLNVDNYYDRIKILQCIIHCTDLSNPTKPLLIYQKWVSRILEEFRRQGDKEREIGIDISPMPSDDKSQIGFIDYIVQPLWETWCDLVPTKDQSIIENLNTNRRFYSMRIGFTDVIEETKDDENTEL